VYFWKGVKGNTSKLRGRRTATASGFLALLEPIGYSARILSHSRDSSLHHSTLSNMSVGADHPIDFAVGLHAPSKADSVEYEVANEKLNEDELNAEKNG
jgi:hypothetical protein